MAQLGRSGLIGESNEKFPTNNAKIIKAIDHRSYNSDMIDSKFNLIDDVLNDVNYFDGVSNVTLENYLNGFVLATGTVSVGDVTNHPIGTVFATTGDFTSSTSAGSNINDLGVIVNGVFGTSKYKPVCTILSLGSVGDDSDVAISCVKNITDTSFQIQISSLYLNSVVTQNIKLLITLNKFDI